MTDILEKLDLSLEEAEEQLLVELERVGNANPGQRFGELDVGVRNALAEIVDLLHHDLQHSGDASNLQLLTDQHEILYARIAVMRTLLNIKVPIDYLERAHTGVETLRRKLDTRAIQLRKKSGIGPKPGERLPGSFDHGPSAFQLGRNRLKVTAREADALMEPQNFLDAGIYSASRELAMIASLAKGGTIEEPPEQTNEDARQGKAVFQSRELSATIPPVNKVLPVREPPRDKSQIAQTPEEIRRKLQERQAQASAAGKANFASRELSTPPPPDPSRRPADPFKRAPEPEPPRSGKAVFASKDVSSSIQAREPVRPQPPKPEPEPPRTGKAVFASRDIEPAYPSDPPRKREEAKKEEEKKEESKKGPAVFEARDLSSNPFGPKKN